MRVKNGEKVIIIRTQSVSTLYIYALTNSSNDCEGIKECTRPAPWNFLRWNRRITKSWSILGLTFVSIVNCSHYFRSVVRYFQISQSEELRLHRRHMHNHHYFEANTLDKLLNLRRIQLKNVYFVQGVQHKNYVQKFFCRLLSYPPYFSKFRVFFVALNQPEIISRLDSKLMPGSDVNLSVKFCGESIYLLEEKSSKNHITND